MKLLLFTVSILLTITGAWLTDFQDAQTQAKKSHKLILLNFAGSDWCAPCIKMTRDIFEHEVFKQYAENNLLLVRADFPRLKKNQLTPAQVAHNEKLAEAYNPKGKFPLTLLLDQDGKVLKSWDGYAGESPQNFIKDIEGYRNAH
jgi:thioredoxin-related protein